MKTSNISIKTAAQQAERIDGSDGAPPLMENFDEVDSFEDFCKSLANNVAMALHGGPSLRDLSDLASNKETVSQVLLHFCSAVAQGKYPQGWVMKFIAEGVERFIKGEVPWHTVARGRGRDVLSAFVQYINERYPGHQIDIAEHLNVTERTVRNYLVAQSDRINCLLVKFRTIYTDKDLAGLLNLLPEFDENDKRVRKAEQYVENNIGSLYCSKTGEYDWDKRDELFRKGWELASQTSQ